MNPTTIRKAVLLAAGKGTRMRELTNDLPKPMIAVRGKPILQHIVEGLAAAGVTYFLIVVGYRADRGGARVFRRWREVWHRCGIHHVTRAGRGFFRR